MKRGLKIVLVLSLALIMSAILIQCGGGHSNGPGSANSSSAANNSGAANNAAVTLLSITVTPANPSIILASGTAQTQQFTATGLYSNGNTENLTSSSLLTWSSSDTSVATIASGGNATVLTYGTTTISAAYGSITGSTAMTVISTASLKSIQVTPVTPSILLGAFQQFLATGINFNGTPQNLTASVTWASSSTAVATISNTAGSNGKASSVAAGETTITAALGSLTGSTILTITAPIQNPLAYTTPVVAALPASIAIDSSGNVWVTNYGFNSVIMLPTALTSSGGVVPSPIPTPSTYSIISESPFGIAIDYVGDIWTANYDSGNVTVLNPNEPPNSTGCPNSPNLTTSAETYLFNPVAAGSLPGAHGIAIDSVGNVWVTNFSSNTVVMLSPNYSFCSTSLSPYSISAGPPTSFTVGNNPYGIAIDAKGNVWVSNNGDGTVSEISQSCSATGNVFAVCAPTFTVGAYPRGIAIDPFGNVWVTNAGIDTAPGNTVTMINPASGTTTNYTVGTGPHSIAIETSGNVWVTNFGTTTAPGNTITELVFNSKGNNYNLTLPANTLTLPYTVGNNPEGLSIDFWGNVWVTNYYGNTLTVWKGATIGPHFTPYSGPIWPQ
jgi:streptogramin lyase